MTFAQDFTFRHGRSASHSHVEPVARKTHARGASLQSLHSSPTRPRRGSLFHRGMLGRLGAKRKASSSSLAGSEVGDCSPASGVMEGAGSGEDLSNFRWDDGPAEVGQTSPFGSTTAELPPPPPLMPSLTHSRDNSSSSESSEPAPISPYMPSGFVAPLFAVGLPSPGEEEEDTSNGPAVPPKLPAKDPYAAFGLLPPLPRRHSSHILLATPTQQDPTVAAIDEIFERISISKQRQTRRCSSLSELRDATPADMATGLAPSPSEIGEAHSAPWPTGMHVTPGPAPPLIRLSSQPQRGSTACYKPRLSTIAPSPDVSCDVSGADASTFCAFSAHSSRSPSPSHCGSESVAEADTSIASSHLGPFSLARHLQAPQPQHSGTPRWSPSSSIPEPLASSASSSPSYMNPQLLRLAASPGSKAWSSQPTTPSSEGLSIGARDYFGLITSPAVQRAMAKLEGEGDEEEGESQTAPASPTMAVRVSSNSVTRMRSSSAARRPKSCGWV